MGLFATETESRMSDPRVNLLLRAFGLEAITTLDETLKNLDESYARSDTPVFERLFYHIGRTLG